MKPFAYYEDVKAECYGYYWVKWQLQQFEIDLDKIALTKAERTARYDEREKELNAELEELNKPYFEAKKALQAEFWQDLRETLAYDKLFNEQGVAHFEALVEEMFECRMLPQYELENDDDYEDVLTDAEDRYLHAVRLLADYQKLRNNEKA